MRAEAGEWFETSRGAFQTSLPECTYRESKALVDGYLSGQSGAVERMLSDRDGMDTAFKQAVGFMGYALGRDLDDGATPEDLRATVEYAYNRLKERAECGGPDPRAGTRVADPELHGAHRVDVEAHLEEAMLMGYWDREG